LGEAIRDLIQIVALQVVELPADDVRQAFKMVHDIRTVGRFTKWLGITFIGIFLGAVVLYENIIKVIG